MGSARRRRTRRVRSNFSAACDRVSRTTLRPDNLLRWGYSPTRFLTTRRSPGATSGSAVADLMAKALEDPSTTWSFGSFGAVASFLRDPAEEARPLPDARMGLTTTRGAIALDPDADCRPVAYETGFAFGWSHAVALCLPDDACAMNRRSVVTELGPDHHAARPEDRDGIVFRSRSEPTRCRCLYSDERSRDDRTA